VYRIVKATTVEKLRYDNSFGTIKKKTAARTDLMGMDKT